MRRGTSDQEPRHRTGQGGPALPAAARIALTGTPVENQLSELWSIMDFTNPGLLGSAQKFRERFAVPVSGTEIPRRQSNCAESPSRSCCAA